MADSAKGVSKTRCSPNFCCRRSVTRKTPPFTPISCPSSTTRSSRSNSSASAELRASIIVMCIFTPIWLSSDIHLAKFPGRSQGSPKRRQVLYGIVKEAIGRHRRHCFGHSYRFIDLCLYLFDELFVLGFIQQVTLHQEGAEAYNGIFCLPEFYLGGITIARRVIGSSMR